MKRKTKKPKGPTPTQRIGSLRAHIDQLTEKLHYAEKSRNALARLVAPVAAARIYLLEDRNLKLELALVLTRQMAKMIRYSWTQQGYPVDAVDAFEADLKRILGE